MSSLNAVEALLTRLSLSNAIPSFRAAGVEKIISLRNLSEDRLKDLLPDPEQRQKLTDALTRNTDAAAKVGPPAIAPGPVLAYNDQQGSSETRSGGPQKVCRYFRTSQGCKKGASCNLPHIDGPPLPTDSAPTAPRQRRACRDFFEGGCKYGAECRYSHNDDANREPAAGEYVNNDTYSEEVQVPFESVRYLLGNKAEKLQRIHTMCGTSNTRIEKPESYMSHYYIRVKGSKEGVQMARAEIERLVGITSAQNTEARFQYVSHELERNIQSCKMLAAFNLASKGTALEMSESTLKTLVNTFRFQVPAKIDHFWMLTGLGDKEKLEVCSRCIKHMPAVQAIIFVDHKRAVEMEKRASMTSQAFGLPAVQFVHRDQTKEVRLASLESFKNGTVRDGLKNRLLVTTSDYAKLARKVVIPYVNMVIHFSIPKTKEIYTFQSLCCGRQGTKGVNLMFILNSDASTQREWSESLPLKEMNEQDWEKSIQDLQYDSETKTLTPLDAEPPANWRQQLEAEQAAKPPKAPAATATAAATAVAAK